jgi:hypothetical protein
MAHVDDLMSLLNAADEHLETIQRLAELAPALDDHGGYYFPHALVLLGVISAYANSLSLILANLAAQVRAREGGAS